MLPITDLAGLKDSSQEVVKTFEHSATLAEKFGVAIGIVLIAPVGEELLFRGALLRSLMRRTSPVVAVIATALVFALVHFIGDTGTGYYVPAFMLLGLISGWRAAVTGRIGQSICLHVGFNLLGAIQILTLTSASRSAASTPMLSGHTTGRSDTCVVLRAPRARSSRSTCASRGPT